MSRKLEDLHPQLQPIAKKFLEECKAEGMSILVTCTYRSQAEQTALYAQGRTKSGAIVTYAKAGQSKHNHEIAGNPASLAFDIVPMQNGICQWSRTHPDWKRAAAIGKKLGLSWAGEWTRFVEYPHFELPLVK